MLKQSLIFIYLVEVGLSSAVLVNLSSKDEINSIPSKNLKENSNLWINRETSNNFLHHSSTEEKEERSLSEEAKLGEQCPNPPPKNPCRERIVDLVEYILNSLKDFRKLCLADDECNTERPHPVEESSSSNPLTEPPSPTILPITTTTVKSPPEESNSSVPCKTANDLGILLDSSQSIGPSNYKLAKIFVANLSSAFVSYPENRLLFIDYSNIPNVVIPLLPKLTGKEIEEKILNTPYQEKYTYTGTAINIAAKNLLKDRREGIPQNLIIFTDGVSTDNAITPSRYAINNGIKIYAVGIGKGVDQNELLQMVGGNRNRMYLIGNYQIFSKLLPILSRQLCPTNVKTWFKSIQQENHS